MIYILSKGIDYMLDRILLILTLIAGCLLANVLYYLQNKNKKPELEISKERLNEILLSPDQPKDIDKIVQNIKNI